MDVSELSQKNTFISTVEFLKLAQAYEDYIPYERLFSFEKYTESIRSKIGDECLVGQAQFLPILDSAEEMINNGGIEHCNMMQSNAAQLILPSMFFDNEMTFIAKPFTKKFIRSTKAFDQFFNSGEWELELKDDFINKDRNIIALGSFILKSCYNIDIYDFYNDQLMLRNVKSGLEKYLEIKINLDYVDVVQTKPLLPLTEDQIRDLLESTEDASLWLELLPPDRFSMKGFVIGNLHEVSKIHIHSKMREEISTVNEQVDPQEKIDVISKYFGSYLNDPTIKIGLANLSFIDLINTDSVSLSLTQELDIRKITSAEASIGNCIYSDVIYRNKTIILDDIERKEKHAPAEKRLIKQGIKSIILIPIENEKGRVISVLEIGSSKKFGVNSVTFMRLGEMIKLMKIMIHTYISELSKDVDILIRDHFTSIHPSVEWRFKEAATKYQLNRIHPDDKPVMDPITFENVYPLYGQADIIGSSKLRNEALASDLKFNLKSLSRLIDAWSEKRNLFLLESYKITIEEKLANLEQNFESQDESIIIDLLHNDIHPLLEELKGRHDDLPEAPYVEYLSIIDQKVGTVYNKRKQYENSVTILNRKISNFFLKEDEKMQSTLPHFFEKYKTDGVEYNIYLGQSILESDNFSDNDLKEFRIWQLQKMAEVTRLVKEVSPTLAVPVKTAQLIFVYNNELNIRFRMEEKKFDVDGTYNVRYEILKKRIDKATIKGSGERLTVEGKVAIVYLQEKDKREYLDYIKFLQHRGFLEDNVELLELNKLQGAEGLKAIRVTVKY